MVSNLLIIKLLKEIFNFLKSPNNSLKSRDSFIRKGYEVLLIYIILIVFSLSSVFVIHLFNTFGLVDSSQRIFKIDEFTENNIIFSLVATICLFDPIYEELTFRLYLRSLPIYISISISLVVYLLLSDIGKFELYSLNIDIVYIGILFFLLLKFFAIVKVKRMVQKFWGKNFKYIFYFSVLLFALLHLRNFQLTPKHIVFIPLLILPQLISGIIFGYSRMKYGIFWSIFLHILNNTIPYILYIKFYYNNLSIY